MEQKNDFLGRDPIGRLLWRMSLPAIVAQLINLLYNLVDRVYIGHMPEDGALALTGVGVCLPIIMIVSAFAALVSNGGAPRASMAMGKGDYDEAEKILGNSVALQIVISAVLTVLLLLFYRPLLLTFGASENTIGFASDYMKIYAAGTVFVQLTLGMNAFITAQGFAQIGMRTVLIGAVVNIVLDPIFIFGLGPMPELGIRGAAWATGIGQTASLLFYLILNHVKPLNVEISLREMRPSKEICGGMYSVGIAATLNMALTSLLLTALNAILAPFSQVYILVLGVYYKLQALLYQGASGVVQGMRPLIGYNYGAGEQERVKKIFRAAFMIVGIIMTAGTLLGELMPDFLMGLFTQTPSTVEIGRTALRLISPGFVMSTVSVIASGAFEGLGMGLKSLKISLMRYAVIIIPIAFVLSRIIGPTGVWHAFWLAELITAVYAGASWKRTITVSL